MSRPTVIATVTSILAKEKDHILAERPGWEPAFMGFPLNGPLSEEALENFSERYKRETVNDEAFLQENTYGLCDTRDICALHAFLFSVKKPRDIEDDLIVHEVIDYLFEEYKIRHYLEARFDKPFLDLICTGKLCLPSIYFYVAVAHSFSKSTINEILHISNYIIDLYNKKTVNILDHIYYSDVNKLSFQYKLRSMTIDNIFLGTYIIVNTLETNLEIKMHDALQEFLKILVDIYFFKNAI